MGDNSDAVPMLAMVAGAFPIVKLAYLVMKQISKPIANQIKRKARSSPLVGKYVCIPPAQVYHWLEVSFRLRLMGLGKAKHVEKLTDEMAIELGAEMLGEFIIFAVAASTILFEYYRSSAKEAVKEEKEKQKVLILKQQVQDLDLKTEVQATKLRELQHAVAALESKNRSLISKLFGVKKPEE